MSKNRKPIILIPGIQGTKLFNVNEKDFQVVWSGVKKFYSNIHRLKLQYDGVNDIGAETIIERADIENLAYSEIINYYRDRGYRVYIFGYDWRKSNVETAKDLLLFVNRIKDKLNENSFNFITHSMGAEVFSCFAKLISQKKDIDLNDIVNKVVFTVPPFLGSVEASFNLVIGKSKLFNSSDDFRKIARTFPAIYELLPVYDGAYEFEKKETKESFNLYDFDTYWQQVKDADRPDTVKKQKLIRKRLKDLGELRTENNLIYDFAKCSLELREKMIVLAGNNSETMQKIYVEEKKGHISNFFNYEREDSMSKEGDGTVPLKSAIVFKKEITTLAIKQRKIESWADSKLTGADWHSFFLNNGRVQNVISRFIEKSSEDLQETNRNNMNWYESLAGGVDLVD